MWISYSLSKWVFHAYLMVITPPPGSIMLTLELEWLSYCKMQSNFFQMHVFWVSILMATPYHMPLKYRCHNKKKYWNKNRLPYEVKSTLISLCYTIGDKHVQHFGDEMLISWVTRGILERFWLKQPWYVALRLNFVEPAKYLQYFVRKYSPNSSVRLSNYMCSC